MAADPEPRRQHVDTAVAGAARVVPVVRRRARRVPRRPSRRYQARKRADARARLRRPAARVVVAPAFRCGAHAARAVRPRARRRVPGHERAAGRSSPRAGVRRRERSLPSATTRRRSTASATPRNATSSSSPSASARTSSCSTGTTDRRRRSCAPPTRSWRRHRPTTSTTRRCGRRVPTVHRRRSVSCARRGRAIGRRVRERSSSSTSAASPCTTRRCCSAPPTTAICSSSSSTARRIPYVKYGGLRFLEAAHVKDLLCVLRIVENPNDELAWFRVLQLLDGVGPATAPTSRGGRRDPCPKTTCPKPAAFVAARARPTARRLDREAGPGAAVERVRAWLDDRVDARYRERVSALGRPRRAHQGRVAGAEPRAVPDRSGPRPAVGHRRAGRPAAPRRRLSDAVDDPLGQGLRVAVRPRRST